MKSKNEYNWHAINFSDVENFHQLLQDSLKEGTAQRLVIATLKELGLRIHLVPNESNFIILAELGNTNGKNKIFYQLALNLDNIDGITAIIHTIKAIVPNINQMDGELIFSFVQNKDETKILIESGLLDHVTHGIHFTSLENYGTFLPTEQIHYRFLASGTLSLNIVSHTIQDHFWIHKIHNLLQDIRTTLTYGDIFILKIEMCDKNRHANLLIKIKAHSMSNIDDSFKQIKNKFVEFFPEDQFHITTKINEIENELITALMNNRMIELYQEFYYQVQGKQLDTTTSVKSAGDIRWFVQQLQIPFFQVIYISPNDESLRIDFIEKQSAINTLFLKKIFMSNMDMHFEKPVGEEEIK